MKFSCTLLFFLFAITTVFSQHRQTGLDLNAGYPTGEAASIGEYNLGVNFFHRFELGSGIAIGPQAGYHYTTGEASESNGHALEGENIAFIPLGATTRIKFPGLGFVVGGDLGYAMGMHDNLEDGFFYRPRVGWMVFDLYQIFGTYTAIDAGGEMDFTTWNFGVEYYF